MRPIRVLELRSVWGTGGGPDKTILAGAALPSSNGVQTVVCYIRDARDAAFVIDQRARQLGLDYVEVIERNSFDAGIWSQLRAVIKSRSIDIVHAHDHKTDFLTFALARRDPIIPLSTAHGFAGDSRNERIYYAVEKRLLAWFPKVIAVSNPIRAELIRTGSRPNRVVVITNAIDHRRFTRDKAIEADVRGRLGFAAGDAVIGAVGRLEWEKRFELLIEAFAAVLRGRADARLVIVGEGSYRPRLEKLARDLGVAERVHLLGLRNDVVALHHAFDVCVQSSITEGAPNAVLEAMAMETPIVATDVGGTRELVTDGVHGLLVASASAPALSEGIMNVLRNPDAAKRRVAAARHRVETDLSFDRRMQKVEEIYVELMSHRSAKQ